MTDTVWQATYAARFNRVAMERPARPAPPVRYVRPSDDELAAMPEPAQAVARAGRDLYDRLAPFRAITESFAEFGQRWVSQQQAVIAGRTDVLAVEET